MRRVLTPAVLFGFCLALTGCDGPKDKIPPSGQARQAPPPVMGPGQQPGGEKATKGGATSE